MTDDPRAHITAMYPLGQLQRALSSLAAAPDAGARARAQAKISRWRSVLAGMADGTLTAGSRAPVAGTPAWVTLDVAHGGFATGRLLAQSPLRDDELALLADLHGEAAGPAGRERLNLWYLSDPGLDRLRRALATGSYRVDVPEDAALPTVAWLLDNGQYEAALDLASELRPWMHQLRFAPRLGVPAPPSGAVLHLRTAGAVAADLRNRQTPQQVTAMRATLSDWLPLYDRLVELWCDTVEGDLPRLTRSAAAAADQTAPGHGRTERGLTAVAGGWPCRRWPADWAQRRRRWLSDYQDALRASPPGRQYQSPRSNFARLRETLDRCETDSSQLTGRHVGWIRRALANTLTQRGAPDSPQRMALRAMQAQAAGQPLHADIARALAARLDVFPADGGIPSAEVIAGDVSPGESATVPAGQQIPPYLVRKALRALDAPVPELVERGIIGSAEVLAEVLPQITAQVVSADFSDPALRALQQQTYSAFRKRRALLLLNLEHQVRFEELPWVAAVQPLRGGADATRAALDTLEQVTLLALTGFPQTILPNPLVAEMTALARSAGLAVPLVEEVAADIFMGTFTDKWRAAALAASESLAGTLYARYYDLPGPEVWVELAPGSPRRRARSAGPAASAVNLRWGKKTAEGFAALCRERSAAGRDGRGSYVAVNGTILEQSQILTTHNLSVLVDALGLRQRVADLAPELAGRTFTWVVRTLGQRHGTWRAGLQAVKNSAYAWRQAIYYLSLRDEPVQAEALAELRAQLQTAGANLEARFAPAVDGLEHVITGGRFDAAGVVPGGTGRRFLGWTGGRHWLLGPPEA